LTVDNVDLATDFDDYRQILTVDNINFSCSEYCRSAYQSLMHQQIFESSRGMRLKSIN